MRILLDGFLLAVVGTTMAETEVITDFIKLERSKDLSELHIEKAKCLLKVTLTRTEADKFTKIAKNMNLKGFTSIIPCINPRIGQDQVNAKQSRSNVDGVSAELDQNYGIKCFLDQSSPRIGEYVLNPGGNDLYNPAKYTESYWGYTKRGVLSLFSDREEIKLRENSQKPFTGAIARKYCFNVAYRAKLIKQLIANWVDVLDNEEEINGDSRETKLIWKHTREILYEKRKSLKISTPGWVITPVGNTETTKRLQLVLHSITKTHDSVIFRAVTWDGRKTFAVKYTNNCAAKDECSSGRQRSDKCPESLLDPLVNEFLIMKIIGAPHQEITDYVAPVPYAYELSETAAMGAVDNAKIESKFVDELRSRYVGIRYCTNRGGTLRGIVEDYVGINLHEHFKGLLGAWDERQYMIEAITMTRRMLGLMWRFHDLGFIHGDFHDGNGAFKARKADDRSYSALTDDMVLIDFEYAEFIPQAYGTDVKIPRTETLNEAVLSPWHLEGYRIGRRDDLFRVMETSAGLLAPNANLHDKFAEIWKFEGDMKLSEVKKLNFFDPDVAEKEGIYCCPDSGSFTFSRGAIAHMKNAMDLILAMTHPDQRPEYEKIIRELDMALFSLHGDAEERKKAELIKTLEELLRKDTTPLPHGDGPTDHGRQIVTINESEFPEDPLNGIRNNISRRT